MSKELVNNELQAEIGKKIEAIFEEYKLDPAGELAMEGYLFGATLSKLQQAVAESTAEASEDGDEATESTEEKTEETSSE